MFLLFIKFKFLRVNGVSEKIEAHFPEHDQPPLLLLVTTSPPPQHYKNCSAPTFLILFKSFLAPPPFKRLKERADQKLFILYERLQRSDNKTITILYDRLLFTEL